MTTIKITAHDGGTFDAYMAVPENPNGAGIIVIQEIFGVNPDVQSKCDKWASLGYVAMAPDLFWRQEPNVNITPKSQTDWDKAFGLLGGFDVNNGVEDIKSTLSVMRTNQDCASGKVGAVGYCLGGRLAYLMATRSTVDASVGYYPVTMENYLNESGNIKSPLLLHIAEEDKFVTTETQATIKSILGSNSYVKIESYPGMNHAFTRLNGDHYNAEAAALANGRTEAFFAQHLLNKSAAAA